MQHPNSPTPSPNPSGIPATPATPVTPDAPTLASFTQQFQGSQTSSDSPVDQPGQHNGIMGRFRAMPRLAQVLIAVGAALTLMVCSCCSCTGLVGALGGGSPTAQSTTAASHNTTGTGLFRSTPGATSAVAHATATATLAPTATAIPSPTPQPTATATPRPRPTATPRPQPTATPKPTCIPGAVNCNPWGYNFSSGHYIYSPPGSFCAYFACIGNFWNGSGYVMECKDGMYSKSGGHQGSCSYHGGNWRALLAP